MATHVPPPAPDEQTVIRRFAQKAKLPLVSGKSSVIALIVCFLLAGGAVFAVGWTVHLPMWIDFELMLLMWWAVWLVALGRLLYAGVRISDDGSNAVAPRRWWGTGSSGGSSGGWGDLGGADFGEGCFYAIAAVVAVILVVALAWFLIEVVIPVLAVILYGLIRGMLARIVNDDHGCTGRFGKSLLWGTVWATAYTAPLAILVWVVHLIVAHKAG
jgi:hypothetical protein